MRFPVFCKGSNPSVDPPIIRKKLTYLESLVADGLADWIDQDEPQKGVISRTARAGALTAMERVRKEMGWGFDTAWRIRESGYAGPLVWQFETESR
jgi:hypothetical protein